MKIDNRKGTSANQKKMEMGNDQKNVCRHACDNGLL